MKTKFVIDFLKEGALNESIAAIVSGHNGGNANCTLSDLKGFCVCFKARYPDLLKGLMIHEYDSEKCLHISEDGEFYNMTISERIVMELSQSETDLLIQSKLS